MPDNKQTPDTPGNTEPSLSDLISSAKEKLQTADEASEQSENTDNAERNDSSGITAEENAEEKTRVMSALNLNTADDSKNNTDNKQNTSDKTDRSDMPDISFKGSPANNETKPAAEPKKPPAEEQKPKPLKPAQTPKPAAEKSAPAPTAPPPAASVSEEKKNGFAKRVKEKKTKETKETKDKKGKKKFTKKQTLTVVGLIASLLLVLVLIVVLLFNYYYSLFDTSKQKVNNSKPMTYSDVDLSKADTIDKSAEEEKLKELIGEGEKISSKEVMNILLIGEDIRDTESGDSGNTDVMMIISVNTKDKTITMTSVMRDCYVYIPGWYSTRINAAYWHGGVDLLKETIEDYMNVQLDRYVLVNFKTFIEIVDTLGGLDITVTDDEANGYEGADPNGDNTRGMQNPLDEQNKYLGNKKGTDYLESGGDLHLNGNQALAYARLRHVGNSDYERTERQRKVITEMIKKSRNMNIIEMDKLATEIFPQIKTDVTKGELAQLLVDMLDYRNYEIQEIRVPADGTFYDATVNGMDVLMVDFEANADIFRETVYGSIELDDDGNEANMTIE